MNSVNVNDAALEAMRATTKIYEEEKFLFMLKTVLAAD